jgi:hypothetical protein
MKYLLAVIISAALFAIAVDTGHAQDAPPPPSPPVTASAGGPYFGYAGGIVEMSGADSTGVNLRFQWDFGDGTRGEGPVVRKVYGRAGTFTVTLTVTDIAGQTATAVTDVLIRVNGATSLPVFCALPVAGHPCGVFLGPVLIPICVAPSSFTGCVVLPR